MSDRDKLVMGTVILVLLGVIAYLGYRLYTGN